MQGRDNASHSLNTGREGLGMIKIELLFFFFFAVLEFELSAYSLSRSTSLLFSDRVLQTIYQGWLCLLNN
jgi:hypothetical protein